MSLEASYGIGVRELSAMSKRGEKIACLTAYDASFAQVLDQAGVDIILVGDSLGMVIQGHNSTVSVSMDDMIYHSSCVSLMSKRALVVVDMPFMSYSNIDQALFNATRLMQEGGAQMVKLEATQRQSEIIEEMSACGIPVCAHLGLRPQYIHKLGGYQRQGKNIEAAEDILQDAISLEKAGADLLLVECITHPLAAKIQQTVSIPVIGIGAGKDCDGQILVLQDILGITAGKTPSFAKNYLTSGSIQMAIEDYVAEVKSGAFPR